MQQNLSLLFAYLIRGKLGRVAPSDHGHGSSSKKSGPVIVSANEFRPCE
jgi:hypothetical protein